jgi:hypothetical protein
MKKRSKKNTKETVRFISPELSKLTGTILQSEKNSSDKIKLLFTLLQKSKIDFSGINFLKNEEELISKEQQQDLFDRFIEIKKGKTKSPQVSLKVFRRETPIISSQIKGSVPDWALGASPSISLGPFYSMDGRNFWFDFYVFTKLISVFKPGDTQPILLLTLKVPLSGSALSFTVDKGSVWLRADLLTAGASKFQYAALKAVKGKIKFSKKVTVLSFKSITIPLLTTFSLDLDLDNSHTGSSPSTYGKDAFDSDVKLPDNVSFEFKNSFKVNSLGDGSWNLYDDDRQFTFSKKDFVFDAILNHIHLPVKTSPNMFEVNKVESIFYSIEGKAKNSEAGWSLPLGVLDINNPLAASGNGAWMLICKKGLECRWKPFPEISDPVLFNEPLILAEPGKFSIGDGAPDINIAETDFNLWLNEDDTDIRSTSHVKLHAKLPVIYFCDESGLEGVTSFADTKFLIDRPVQVDESPVNLSTEKSFLAQWMTDALQYVTIFDADMLTELNPFDKFKKLHTQSYALTNGLMVTTPPAAILFVGELKNDNSFDDASLTILYGLFSLIPALPHPYASTIGLFERNNIIQNLNKIKQASQWTQFIRNNVIAFVKWTEDPVIDKTLSMVCDFRLLGNLLEGIVMGSGVSNQDPALLNNQDGRMTERVALLDVSTQADLFGVGMLWNNNIYRSLRTGVAEHVSEGVVNISSMNLQTPLSLLTSFTVPGISWEPMINIAEQKIKTLNPAKGVVTIDPPKQYLGFSNSGVPTMFFHFDPENENIDAEAVLNKIVDRFNSDSKNSTNAIFNLPFGIISFAELKKINQQPGGDPTKPVNLQLTQPLFTKSTLALKGALQLSATGAPNILGEKSFQGLTVQQLNNLVNITGSLINDATPLGNDVYVIFNNVFSSSSNHSGVPVERIDFSGYGNTIFSDWRNPEAKFADVSEVRFDVWKGRTAKEIIQVVSILIPWGIKVVRTITITRENSAIVYRDDSGWRAQSDGLYDFTLDVQGVVNPFVPYIIHPGVVTGLYNITNIEDVDGDSIKGTENFILGDLWYDPDLDKVRNDKSKLPTFDYIFQAVSFNADVKIDGAELPSGQNYVSGKKFKAYVQLEPRGVPVPARIFSKILKNQSGSLGGEVDVVVKAGGSKQKMKISRVDVNASFDSSKDAFIAAAKGSVILPAEGSWSLVIHDQDSSAITPADNTKGVPLLKIGKWKKSGTGYVLEGSDNIYRIEDPDSLLNNAVPGLKHYGFLQNTGTQKLLLRQPRIDPLNLNQLVHENPDYADSFRLLNSTGPFPKITDVISLNSAGSSFTSILSDGLKKEITNFQIPDKTFDILKIDGFRLYAEYKRTEAGSSTSAGKLNLNFDSAAKEWTNDMNNVQLVVDLGSFDRLMTVSGCMNAANGIHTGFNPGIVGGKKKMQVILCKELQPIYDILVILASLDPSADYKDILEKGLEVAMSNSADNWEYKFHAEKEIPVIKFPPGELYNAPQTPFKLQAGLKVGAYFNMSVNLPNTASDLVPSAGAYLQLDGQVEVLALTLEIATIYAVGTATMVLACDIKSGPSLYFKFGVGAEIVVGLPVILNVSVIYVVGVDIKLDTKSLTIGAFIRFQGSCDILGGLIGINIMIEGGGQVKRSGDETYCIANLTFALDISILWVIDISFEESWTEQRQIASPI